VSRVAADVEQPADTVQSIACRGQGQGGDDADPLGGMAVWLMLVPFILVVIYLVSVL